MILEKVHVTLEKYRGKMPIFTINTNLSKEKVPVDFLQETTSLVATSLGKPVSYVVVHINTEQQMCWGGTSDTCALSKLSSIGKLGKDENKQLSKVLFDHIEKRLGIKKDRMYIDFSDLDKAYVGYMGKTFDDLL